MLIRVPIFWYFILLHSLDLLQHHASSILHYDAINLLSLISFLSLSHFHIFLSLLLFTLIKIL